MLPILRGLIIITDKADELVRIPMQGKVESLNAAIACTILTYEAVRQRL